MRKRIKKLGIWLSLFLLIISFGVTTAASFLQPQKVLAATVDNASLDDQVKSYLYYMALSGCMHENPLRDGVYKDYITPDDAAAGYWFAGGIAGKSASIGQYINNSDGVVTCNDDPQWISDALALWGWTGKTQALCDFGFKRDSGGNSVTDCVNGSGNFSTPSGQDAMTTSMKMAIELKYYGKRGEPQLTPAMNYLLNAKTFEIGCNATAIAPAATATPDQKSSARYTLKVLDNDGNVVDMLFSGDDPAKKISLSVGPDYSVHEDDCATLVAHANSYAAAFATYISAHPNDSSAPGKSNAVGSSSPQGDDAGIDNCSAQLTNPLSWFICPVIDGLTLATVGMENVITSLMSVDTTQVFDTSTPSGAAYYKAWNTFRIFGVAIIIIAGLVMIISQALGMEIFDAYTIRKVLPRLFIAVIAVSLSWYLLKFLCNLTNDVGQAVRTIIYYPFSGPEFSQSGLSVGAQAIGDALLAGSLFALGIMGLLSLVATAALAALIAFAVLVIRYLVIIFLIIIAPIAIACYVLPNTEKAYKMWWDTLSKALLMFPIIMAIIATGHVFAKVSYGYEGGAGGTINSIVAVLAYFLPYFMLPFAFRLAGGAISTIAGLANDRSRGAFDRLRNFRGQRVTDNMAAVRRGFGQTRLGSRFAEGDQRRQARLSAWGSGAVGIGGVGTRRYRDSQEHSHQGHLAAVAAESIKNNPSAALNDDANAAAQRATSRDNFLDLYVSDWERKQRDAGRTVTAEQQADKRREAQSQLAYTEQAWGTSMGSAQMRHTAGAAALSSSAASDSIQERTEWMQQAVTSGVMSDSQAASYVKQSGSLMSSAGFGDLLAGANGGDWRNVSNAAAVGFNPANSHRMRPGQAKELAQHLRLQASMAAAGPGGTSSDDFAKIVADSTAIHDMINGMTPEVREEFATEMSGVVIGGQRLREWATTMEATGNNAYLDRHKTWSTAAVGASAGNPGGGGGPAPGGPVPGGPPPGGGAPGAPPSDRRLKKDILLVGQTVNGINLYRFRYIWDNHQEYVGVMAQDLVNTHPEALRVNEHGYYLVDYSMLGLQMLTVEEWHDNQAKSIVRTS